VVNDEVVTTSDVEASLSELLEQDPDVADGADPSQMRQAVLQRLIQDRLLLQEAKKLGVSVSSEQVLRRLEEVRARFESEEAFAQSLRDSGISREQLKEKLRDQMTVRRLIDGKVRSTIVISPQDVARELQAHPELARAGDRVRGRHLLIRVYESRSEEKARSLIEQLRAQLAGGASFEELARQHSEDSHREDGGGLGWVAPGQLMPELDAALFSLQPGELSLPIQSRLGFHLVKVEERRTAESLSVLEANTAVYQRLYQRRFQQEMSRWVEGLMRRAYIELIAPEAS
jgi:parvulin-like peptidyl-prolyl isomerase